MDLKSYLERHIPHRVNLLLTYRERFGPVGPDIITVANREVVRDFYRCAKDSSMMMIRYFFEELGVTLSQKDTFQTAKHVSVGLEKFHVKRLTLNEANAAPDKISIIAVLVVANRAVAHLDENVADDGVQDDQLVAAINFTEALIRERIYWSKAQGVTSYDHAMRRADNQMHRGELTRIIRTAGR